MAAPIRSQLNQILSFEPALCVVVHLHSFSISSHKTLLGSALIMVHVSASRRRSVVFASLFAGLAAAAPTPSDINLRKSSLPGDPSCTSDVCQACAGKDVTSVVVENFPPLAGGSIRKCSDGSLWYGRGVNIECESFVL